MSKRSSSLNEVPPAKRSRRAAGFRLARAGPVSAEPSTSSSSTSLFVTVSQPQEGRGTLQAQNRVLPSTQDSSATSSKVTNAQPVFDRDTEAYHDETIQNPEDPLLQQTPKPKRKRNMTNAVCVFQKI
jgi:hypothetical protein